LLSRHNWRKLESSVYRMSMAFSSWGAISTASFIPVIPGFLTADIDTSLPFLAGKPAGEANTLSSQRSDFCLLPTAYCLLIEYGLRRPLEQVCTMLLFYAGVNDILRTNCVE
jgi:hypothetical protein